MNVGIITFHNHYNYGAVLQAFALNYVVRKLGHECRTINCNIEPGVGRLKQKAKNPGATITKAYNMLNWSANERFDKRFKEFIAHYIPISDIEYNKLDHLLEDPPRFDAYITGSDQVWRPTFMEKDIGHAFHLCFAKPEKSRLISYAPSFGASEITDQYKPVIRDYLRRYHFLSIRENRGKEIIQELLGKEAVHVVDPTVLLSREEYQAIVNPPEIERDYILVYAMELGEGMAFLNLVKKVKSILNLPVVCIFPLRFDFRWLRVANRIMLDTGPKEFLGLIQNAKMVCTNSFHGTVFSIKYQKRFIGTPHSISNSRIESLLGLAAIQDRQLYDPTDEEIEEVLEAPIDYCSVDTKIEVEIENSLSFLHNALS